MPVSVGDITSGIEILTQHKKLVQQLSEVIALNAKSGNNIISVQVYTFLYIRTCSLLEDIDDNIAALEEMAFTPENENSPSFGGLLIDVDDILDDS